MSFKQTKPYVFFFVNKKIVLRKVPVMAKTRFQNYKNNPLGVAGLPQQWGNQPSHSPSHHAESVAL
jgi:hypothetical protein